MAPSKWDDEEDSNTSSSPASSPPPVARRNKFDDEEDEEDVVSDWEQADEEEAEKQKAAAAAAAAKAKAEAEAQANKKPKKQRIEERIKEHRAQREAESESSDEEEDAERRARLRQTEQDADLKHAEDLFGNVGLGSKTRSAPRTVVAKSKGGGDTLDPSASVDLGSLPMFNPKTKAEFQALNDSLAPLISALHKNGHYTLFVQDFAKNLARDLPSTEIKKISTALSTLGNEKMKEEKASEKGGKKTKAAKTKNSLVGNRDLAYKADTSVYDDDLGDDDFM